MLMIHLFLEAGIADCAAYLKTFVYMSMLLNAVLVIDRSVHEC